MRLLTYDREGAARLGLLLGERVIDLADAGRSLGLALPDGMLAFIEEGDQALEGARQVVDSLSSDPMALSRSSWPLAGARRGGAGGGHGPGGRGHPGGAGAGARLRLHGGQRRARARPPGAPQAVVQ